MSGARHRVWAVALAALLGLTIGPAAVMDSARAAAVGTVMVSASSTLNVRSGPSTSSSVVGSVRNGHSLAVVCQVSGESIVGRVRTSSTWNQLSTGGYVSDAYVIWPSGAAAQSCLAGARVKVVDSRLNIRPNTSRLLAPVGALSGGNALQVSCQLGGESITGTAGTSALWNRLGNGGYVADAYVSWPYGRPSVPWCSLTGQPAPGVGGPFVEWAGGHAQQMRREFGVPASVIIAQAILESGWGRSSLTRDGNSYFGMKCFGTPGRIATGCRPYKTTECGSAGCYGTSATFRVYNSAAESFRDHSNQYATLARYQPAFAHANNPDEFARAIHRAGYATSPTYAQNLINLMHTYNLYRFDS